MKSSRGTCVLLAIIMMYALGSSRGLGGERKISLKQLPVPVRKAFDAAYPGATIRGQSVETEKSGKFFEIESIDGKTRRDILYTPDGKAVETEETVDPATLGAELKNAVAKAYPNGRIVKAERVTKDSGVTYEFHITVGKKSKELVLDAAGTVVPERGEKGEKDEKEDD